MPEVTENYVHIPVSKKKKNAQIVTITLSTSQGIKALYDKKNKQIITYLFSTTKWTMKQAKDWVKRHKRSTAHLVVAENLYLVEAIEKSIESKRDQIINEVIELIEGRREL